MSEWRGYIQFEALSLNAENFTILCEAFAALPPVNLSRACDYMHGRTRLDGLARGFEMKFDPAHVEVSRFIQFMADLFSVDAGDVGYTIDGPVSYSGGERESQVWTFSYPAGVTNRLRVIRFGRGSTWDDSRLERRAYLIAHIEEWETELS